MSPRPSRTLALFVTLLGCGSESTPVPPSTPVQETTVTPPTSEQPATPIAVPSPSATTTTVAPTTAPTPTTAAHRPRGRRLSAADRARITEALREGRRLTRAGQHAESLVRFEEALAIDASPWRVQCEAAFVAWRAENNEASDAHLRRAMNGIPPGFVPEAQRVPMGMCLFNAGLVYEAHGDTDRARGSWQESLRLRPSAAVEARLAALPPVEESAPAWQRMPASTPMPELIASMRTLFHTEGLAGFEAGELQESAITLLDHALGQAPGLEAHHIVGRFAVPAGGEQLIQALVVRAGDVQRAMLLGQAYSAGMDSSTTELDATPRLEDVLPGGQPELVVSVTSWGGSTDCWGSERHLILCTSDLGALQCITMRLAELSACIEGEGEEESTEGYCREVRFEGGAARFEGCREGGGQEPPFIDGTYPLAMLFSRGDLRWPDVWRPLEPVGS